MEFKYIFKIFMFFAIFSVISCNLKYLEERGEKVSNNENNKYPTYQKEFQKFILKYQKNYKDLKEFKIAYDNFKENYHNILLQNNSFLNLKQQSSFEIGVTKFFDMSRSDFKKMYLNLKPGNLEESYKNTESIIISQKFKDDPLPENFDWREKGAVGPVKNQYICGSCWTFSTTGNIEGLYFLKYNQSVLFSEQQMIDCDRDDYGCKGGWMESAFKYLIKTGGIETEKDYYYRGFDDECSFNKMMVKAKLKSYKMAKTQDEDEIARMLLQYGPLSIGVNGEGLQGYKKGIVDYEDTKECPNVINHGVLLVGFGVENNQKFWIVKNSWGKDWGEEGFFRIARGKGLCGINKYVVTGELE
jgi:cathepsin F